jgi:alkaline phosphatase D
MDQWDGYVGARNRILGFLHQRRPSNPVVITGDIHSSWVCDLKADFAEPSSATVGTEFVGTAISSVFPPSFVPLVRAALPDNPHISFFDGALRGYVRCDLTRERWQSDLQAVASVSDPNASLSTLASFVVENGRPGAVHA